MKKESLITKDQYDRLVKFAPLFSKYMLEGIMPNRSNNYTSKNGDCLSISTPHCCIVGECHNFSDDYYDTSSESENLCRVCADYADSLYQYADGYSDITDSFWFQFEIDKFLDHVELFHKDLIKQ